MDLTGQLQSEVFFRVLAWAALIWIVIAICTGLWASEMKKRPFWLWVFLSLISGPIAWYLIFLRLPVYIPHDMRMQCPKCGKTISKDAKSCRYCGTWLDKESKDRAGELGRQAAAMVFTLRHIAKQRPRRDPPSAVK